MRRVSKLFTICAMAALVTVAVNYEVIAQGHPFPVSFKYHCGGKARYTIPKAMGFSPDCKTLAIWYIRSLIFLDAATGKEITRVRTADELSYGNPYNYVTFDPTGKYCCISYVGYDKILLQFFDIEKGIGARPVTQKFKPHTSAEPGPYVSYGYYLPLRQWLTIHMVGDETEATCEALFPKADDQAETKVRFHVSLNGNSRLKKAEQIFSAMRGEEAIKKAFKNEPYVGLGMQVALSQDQQTLLTQFIEGEVLSFRYRFVFYDAKSKKKVTELKIPTGIDWRFNGCRGFTFSPDFRQLARNMPGGHVIVHDLSKLAERKLDGSGSILIPFGYGTTTEK